MRTQRLFLFFLSLFFIFHSQISYAGNPAWQLTVTGTVVVYDAAQNKNVPAAPCKVLLYKDDVQIKEIDNPAHGAFSFLLDPDHDYIIAAQNDGYIKQQVIVSTKDVPDDSWKHFKTLDLQMSIFKTYPDYNYSFAEKPLVKFCYNYSEDDFDYDSEYELAMRANANKMQALSDIAIDHQVYLIDIAKGDSLFKMENWESAKALYGDASKKLLHESYPKDQIKICDEKLQEIAKEQEKKDSAYASLLNKADAKFSARDYAKAKTIYQQASAIHPELMYPKSQLQECDRAIAGGPDYEKNKSFNDSIFSADGYFAGKDYLNAKKKYLAASKIKPAEQYPKDQIKKCDEEIKNQNEGPVFASADKQYTDLIAIADRKFKQSDYAGAKSKYSEASKIKPAEQYPKDQIKICDAKLQGEPDNSDKYKALISEADKLFAAKDYKNAEVKYKEASSLKSTEQYPKNQIMKCENIVNDIDKPYHDTLALADKLFGSADYENAKIKYAHASSIHPDEQYPKDRMSACDVYAAAEKEKKYNDAIVAGDEKMKAKDWPGAKAKYQEASALKPNVQYPKDQIGICDQAIANGW